MTKDKKLCDKVKPVLSMEKVSKRFPGTLAVDNVDFSVLEGEVHALMGENGAGKSTLMKTLAGSFTDYTGKISVCGKEVRLNSPQQAKDHGIEMIYQELSLAQPLSVAENILAGRLAVKNGIFLDNKKNMQETQKYLELVGLEHIHPLTPIEQLSQHEAQLIEIAKALSNQPKILVMDEPTSALSQKEVDKLFEIIDHLKSTGITIIYISHHLPEIFKVADRVTVMRDGKKVETRDIVDVSPELLVEMMLGKAVSKSDLGRYYMRQEKRLSVRNFTRYGFFHDISFDIHKGEILGIGGLAGSGRSEIARSLTGLDPYDFGQIELDGEEITPENMAKCICAGIGYLTEDRKLQGLALNMTAMENVITGQNVCKSSRVSKKQGLQVFDNMAKKLELYPAEPERQVSQFSGGNQQKVMLAKWLALSLDVLIVDEPTRGVDIGAKEVIHNAIIEQANQGKCVLVISSDLPELVRLSDRVLILRKGHFIREIQKESLTENEILLAANGESVTCSCESGK